MPTDFKLNLNLSPREKRLATPFAQVMRKKAYTHLIYCYGDTVILSFHAFFLPSFLQGPQTALTDRI